jgi:hypothetical protein
MASLNSTYSSKTTTTQPSAVPLKVPRLVSLEHRLQHAKDADGQPIPLIDELLFFLDDPPAGTADRWQEGADLCAEHGIKTSRMAVWRFYRANILQWRREQMPLPPAAPVDPQEIARLEAQARLLAAQRMIEMLNDPNLSSGQLIGILQNLNQREKHQLARDQFYNRVEEQRRERERNHHKNTYDELQSLHRIARTLQSVPPHTTK